MNKTLVTGGAGYIGSHTVVALIEQGYQPVIYDNLSNSNVEVLNRIEKICGVRPEFVEGDLRDKAKLKRLFSDYDFDSVIHFAGLKAVGESVSEPLRYYHNNVVGTLMLLEAMDDHCVRNLVFSSSATVYGEPQKMPITEEFPLSATNPYGQTKLAIETILRDLSTADSQWQISLLRYFNPVSAHESGLIGEDPDGIPNNLMPFIAQVAVGKLDELSVFGDDYPTSDGTGVRDYIHVVDLARAHIKALQVLSDTAKDSVSKKSYGCQAYNIGTGIGYSVLQMVQAFERASGHTIKYQIKPRRPGDIATCYADTTKSAEKLSWQAEFDLERMMQDGWRWQSNNPNGYE
jgi:UDP-glucose 4-epimerase